ncbi:MAG: hypothetical protein Q9204_008370 [Flavoplaca sp. TL-2023a]
MQAPRSNGQQSFTKTTSTSLTATTILAVSCAYCRTPIMDEGRNMILLFPTLIDFKDPEDRKNFDISRRVLDINDGKPKWTGLNDSSDLIADSPQEAVNELKRKRQDEEQEKSNEQK